MVEVLNQLICSRILLGFLHITSSVSKALMET
jgi:hypothetical protein